MTQRNVIELVVKTTDLASAQLRKLQGGIKSIAGQVLSLKGAFVGIGAGLVFRKFLAETANAQRAAARLDAAYANVSKTVGVTRQELDRLATSMQRNTVIDDDTVKSAEAILLTFSKVRGEAFGKTMQVAADLSARMGTDLVGSVRILGQALEDPAQGMDRLRRSGVIFTAEQKDMIRTLVETGQSGKAVNVMLDTLAAKLGGSAAAEANTLGGALTQLSNTWGDLFEGSTESTQSAVDSIHDLRDALEDPRFKSAFDKLSAGFTTIGAAAVGGVAWAADAITRVFENAEQRFERLNQKVAAARKSGDMKALSAAEGERDRFITGQESIAKGSKDPNQIARAREMRAYASGTIQRPPDRPIGAASATEETLKPELTEEQIKGLRNLREELVKQKDALELQARGAEVSAQAVNNLSVKAALAKLNLSGMNPAASGVADALNKLNDATVRAAVGSLTNEFTKERDAIEAQRKALAGSVTALDDLAIAQTMAAAGVTDLTALTDKQWEAMERLQGVLRETQAAREALTTDQTVKRLQDETAALEMQASAGWRAADAVAALRQEQELRGAGVSDPSQIARAEQARQAAADAARRSEVQGLRERLDMSRMIASDVEAENELRRIGVERTSAMGREIIELVRAQQESRIAVAGIENAFDSMFSEVDNGIKGMARAFLRSIQRMLAELMSNKLKNALLSQLNVGGGGGGGLLGTFLTNLVGGAFTGGGGGVSTGGGGSRPPGTIFTAGGGYTRGLTMVGEEGPELLALPGGSRVYNRRQVQFAGAGGGGGMAFAPVYNIEITGARNDDQMRSELMAAMIRKSEADKREIFNRLQRNGFPRIR